MFTPSAAQPSGVCNARIKINLVLKFKEANVQKLEIPMRLGAGNKVTFVAVWELKFQMCALSAPGASDDESKKRKYKYCRGARNAPLAARTGGRTVRREARAGHSLIKTIGEGPWLLGPHLHSGQLRAGRPPPSSQVSNTRSARPLKGVTRATMHLYIFIICAFVSFNV